MPPASMNALVAASIDARLRDRGRRSVDDLAPSFAAYLTRTRSLEQGDGEVVDGEEPDFA